ncbi:MAG: trypsin-like peptidase domain-containing protein, partial [Candidatus Promineifilaceae bacterium]
GETYYMVMEYLVGETLQARLKRLNTAYRYMPLPDVIRFCRQMCDAVGYAHNHELIHRDIKPANIMLDLNGQAILMDFGIVKIIGGEYHTATGATIGTAMYMSPEQIRSERATERSDIYSLGVTLYEMIGGRTPFQADSMMTLMMMVLNDPLPDLREIRKGVPDNLLAVVDKALAKEETDRFHTMDEMASALQQAQEEVVNANSVATVLDDDPLEQSGAPDSPVEESAQTKDTATEQERAEALGPEDEAIEVEKPELDSDVPGISADPALVGQANESIIAHEQVAPAKLRDKAKHNYRRLIIAAAVLLLLAAAIAIGIVYSQSQKAPTLRITPIDQPPATINAQTAQYVVNLARWETSSFIEELAYSPDGKLLGTANNRNSMLFSPYRFYGGLWRIDNGSLQKYLLGHSEWVYSAAFSPDGQLFATASDDDSVILWQVSDGSLARKIEASIGGITNVDFSPNNLLLATGSWDGNVGLWQLSDGHLLRMLPGHENSVMDVEFSPNGKLLASASDDHTIRLWQVSDGSLLHTLRGHTAPIHQLAFSPDGNWLASASEDHTIGIWQVSDGSLVRSLLGHSEPVFDVAFSIDGSLLASGSEDGTLSLWRVTDGELLRTLTEHTDSIASIAFSPDGYTLVSGADDGVLRFWGLSEAIPLETEMSEPQPEVVPMTPPTPESLQEESTPEVTPTEIPSNAVSSLDELESAVVQIVAEGSFVDPEFGLQLNAPGRGSGFIINEEGIAVTNNHVVTGAALLRVRVAGESEPRNARVLAASECSDLALIDIEGSGFPFLEWYDGDISTGLEIYAAGFPLGDPEYTLTSGIISKDNADGESTWSSVNAVLEHDATTNPGNSGGPIVTADGKVVGVHYASNSSTRQQFAITRDEALGILAQLEEGQDVTSIGVNGSAVNDGQISGIWVSSVKSGSPADLAGVQGGDIINTIEGLVLATDGTMADYCDILRSHRAEDVLSIEVLRYATQEVLAGQLNGDELAPVFSFAQEIEDQVGSGLSEDAATYDEFVEVTDDSGTLVMEVPVAWSADVDGSPFLDDDGSILAASIQASVNLHDFWSTYATPGVVFYAADSGGQELDMAALLDEFAESYDCTLDGRYDYDNGVYTGLYDLHTDCGGVGSVIVELVAAPGGQQYFTFLVIQAVTEADLDAMDHILNTFSVLEELTLPGSQ